jgi:hypothetical protein
MNKAAADDPILLAQQLTAEETLAIRVKVNTFVEPVSRNRPGRESSSTVFLIANNGSGARWVSLIMARSNPPG